LTKKEANKNRKWEKAKNIYEQRFGVYTIILYLSGNAMKNDTGEISY